VLNKDASPLQYKMVFWKGIPKMSHLYDRLEIKEMKENGTITIIINIGQQSINKYENR